MKAIEEVGHLADVPLEVMVELDRRILSMREVLELNLGSVVKMSRSAGENLDILVGGVVIGFGEIVVTETTTGVRITDFKHED